MFKNNNLTKNVTEQVTPPEGTEAATTATTQTATGASAGKDKIEALSNAMQQLQTVLSVGTAGSAPSQAAKEPKSAKKSTTPTAGKEPARSEKRGTQVQGVAAQQQQQTVQQQVQQSIAQPTSTQGFVELEADATDQAIEHISKKLGVDGPTVKKLTMTRGVRILIDPRYLSVK